MKTMQWCFLSLFILLTGCAATGPAMTPLEIESLQSREYENSKMVVFASVVSVFQDLGYTIKSADKETGFIMAESAASSDTASKILLGVSNVSQTSATAFIEQIGSHTLVRLNFVTSSKKSSSYGQTDREDTPILDVRIYRNAFERIESAIFVRSDR